MPRLTFSAAESADGAGVTSAGEIRDFSFKAGKREISGIVMTRTEDDGSVRAVATTYFGMTLFDITLDGDSYTVNSCADFLDRKSISAFIASRMRKAVMKPDR